MAFMKLIIPIAAALSLLCCTKHIAPLNTGSGPQTPSTVVAESFAYPISEKGWVTPQKDTKDEWYNALDFGEENHLGEDWNKNTGGNSDCGEAVYAVGSGVITYAADAGPGWGNVVIITHTLPDGSRVQSLYGHMLEILKTSGEVLKREQIGKIGSANGKYLCHLHLELRDDSSRDWDRPGGGYSTDQTGWLDPSDFIDNRRKHER